MYIYMSVRCEEEGYIEAVYKAGALGYMVCQTLQGYLAYKKPPPP
jgi:hypothetical protein